MNKLTNTFFAISIFFGIFGCQKDTTHPLYIEGDGLFDIEGNYYNTVVIGNQEWLAENFRSTIYCSGDSIPTILGQEYFKTYDNNASELEIFGLHYNYQAVEDTSGLCPCGWHVPSETDFDKLVDYLGGYIQAWPKMKSTGLLVNGDGNWDEIGSNPSEYAGTNTSGFNVQPAGIVFYDSSLLRNIYASFWAVSNDGINIPYYEMGTTSYVGKQTMKGQTEQEENYFSVRCIKDL